MRKLVLVLAVVLFAVPAMTIASPTRQSAEMKVLNQWLGNWKSHAVMRGQFRQRGFSHQKRRF